MQLKAVWEFLRMLPFFIDLYKKMKAYAKERDIQSVDKLAKEFLNEKSSSKRAKHIINMFK
jgi:hypothetical protein